MSKEAPKIVFPCCYPIKVLGRAGIHFRAAVVAVCNSHAPDFDQAAMSIKDSRNGTFQSITITIEAQSEEQLRLIHSDLMDTGFVSMVI